LQAIDTFLTSGNKNHQNNASEPFIRNQQSPLQAINAFLTNDKAFTQLKVNLASILHPSLSFENALSSKSVFVIRQYISRYLNSMADNNKEQVIELRKKSQSNIKIAQFLLEKAMASPGTIIEKNPKPALAENIMALIDDMLKDQATLGNGQILPSETAVIQSTLTGQAKQEKPPLHNRPQLVIWKCSCGIQLYNHYIEIVPGSLEQLQQRLRQENSSYSGS
jgi:hypothetical protein